MLQRVLQGVRKEPPDCDNSTPYSDTCTFKEGPLDEESIVPDTSKCESLSDVFVNRHLLLEQSPCSELAGNNSNYMDTDQPNWLKTDTTSNSKQGMTCFNAYSTHFMCACE